MKIVITGCGLIADTHVRALEQVQPGARILLCDRDRSRAEALARKWSLKAVHTDLAALLASEKPDAVHIVTPPPTHATLATQAIRAGCHVYVEKPVTETRASFEKLAALAAKKQVVLYPGYSTLGMPVVLRLKREMAGGRFGRLIAVHCTFGCSWPNNRIPYNTPDHWAYALKGGILQNMIDHPASLVLDLLAPIKHHKILVGRRNVLPYDCPDLLHVALENEDQVGSFTLSLGHGSADRRAHLLFEKGSVTVDMGRMLFTATEGRGPHNFVKKAASGLQEGLAQITGTFGNAWQTVRGKLRKEPGITNLIENFYANIAGQAERLVRDETVLEVTHLLDVIWNEIDYRVTSNGRGKRAGKTRPEKRVRE
ncbi:MAG: Gfo/Idh/MocA family protein [bacterium]